MILVAIAAMFVAASVIAQNGGGLQVVINWPMAHFQIGQVSGVDVDGEGNVVIVHRAYRRWEFNTFDDNNKFDASKGKINVPVIVTMDKKTGLLLAKRGANRFYLPHGLTVDDKNNVWVTDVAAHQVFKFAPGSDSPVLTLGEALTPGNDISHFCKPTDVAVATNGQFFVSDGYCNHRIMKFAANGTFLKQWGHSKSGNGALGNYDLLVPHSLTLAEDDDVLCVADREHERIPCYYAGLKNETRAGEFWATIHPRDFGRVFAIAYDSQNAVMHMVNGPSMSSQAPARGMTVDTLNGEVIDEWAPLEGFWYPHDVAVSRSGDDVFVADVEYSRVWKFTRT